MDPCASRSNYVLKPLRLNFKHTAGYLKPKRGVHAVHCSGQL